MSTFFRPVSNTNLKSMALAALGASALVVPVRGRADAWIYSQGALTQSPVSAAVSGTGFCAAVAGASGDAWLCQNYGSLVHLASGAVSATVSGTYALPSGRIFEGAVFVSGAPYLVAADGSLWTLSGAVVSGVGAGYGSSPAKALAVSGTALFTLLASSQAVGTFALTTNTSGTITTPMTVPACLAASSSGIAVGGWNYATLASGYASLAADPAVATAIVGASSAAGHLDLITSDVSGNWSIAQTVSGLTGVAFAAWSPNGNYIFADSPTAGTVDVVTYIAGNLALSQSLALSNASAAAFTTNSLQALVCRPSQNSVQTYVYGGTWAASGAVAINNPQSVLGVAATQAVVGCASGLAVLDYGATAWSVASTVALPYVPTALGADSAGNVYAAGVSGVSGIYSVVSGLSGVVASGSWAGGVSGLTYVQGQLVIGDPANDLLRIFGPTSGTGKWAQQSSVTTASGVQALAFNNWTLFAAMASGTAEYNFTGPYRIAPVRSGEVSIYSSGAVWHSLALNVGQQPTAITWNPSGQVSVATLQNMLYTVSVTGGLLSSGAVLQFSGQPQSTPIGLSYLQWLAGSLYASTSLNDSLAQIP